MSEYINGGASELVSYGLGDAGYNFGITSPDLFVYPTFIGLSRSYLSIWPAYEKGVGADQGLSDVILSGKPTFDSTIDLLHDFYSSGGNIFHSNVRDMTFSYPVDNMTAKSLYVVSAVGGDQHKGKYSIGGNIPDTFLWADDKLVILTGDLRVFY